MLFACGGDPNFDEDAEAVSHESLTCAEPQMTVFPVAAAHNIGWDRSSCGSGRCAVSCPDRNANSDWDPSDHQGIDVFAHRRAPMVAVANGTIVAVGTPSATSGLRVRLRDGCGWEYYYGHLDEAVVRSGQTVRAGQLIGYMGNTGTGGVHLHFNVSPDGRYSSDINPFNLLRQTSGTACTTSTPPPPSGAVSADVAFDAAFYLARYDDLRAAFGTNAAAARQHWQQHGIREGRRGSPELDPRWYLGQHADVANAYGRWNYQGAIDHFVQYGAREGRAGSSEVRVARYLALHSDLRQAFGATNYPAALQHYRTYGLREGRQSANHFDPAAYLARYADLRRAYGNDHRRALVHWIRWGRREGRNARP
ncbi:MAG: M23 family metallopeptidase [Deltaproteobacteria bacterium]